MNQDAGHHSILTLTSQSFSNTHANPLLPQGTLLIVVRYLLREACSDHST